MIHLDAALGHDLFQITIRYRVAHKEEDCEQDHILRKLSAFERDHRMPSVYQQRIPEWSDQRGSAAKRESLRQSQLPLVEVLADYINDLSKRFPAIQFDLNLAPRLAEPDEATAVTVFRILQDGMTNALRHSGASCVSIRLWTEAALWRMILSDDGTGMPGECEEGAGLTGMRERVVLLGGRLDLSSGPYGTSLAARLPRGCDRHGNHIGPTR